MEKDYKPEENSSKGVVEEPSVALSYGEPATVFNPVQQHLLKMFAYDGSEERLEEVKSVLSEHFSKLMDKRLDEIWDAGILDQSKLDDLRNIDLRKV